MPRQVPSASSSNCKCRGRVARRPLASDRKFCASDRMEHRNKNSIAWPALDRLRRTLANHEPRHKSAGIVSIRLPSRKCDDLRRAAPVLAPGLHLPPAVSRTARACQPSNTAARRRNETREVSRYRRHRRRDRTASPVSLHISRERRHRVPTLSQTR